MSYEVLERLISSYMATNQKVYTFGWQGGEPTLMGVEFFRWVTELQQRYGRSGAVVSNGLQTNGTLIDDALAAHLSRYKFLVGISLDGPPDIHDLYRTNASGQGSHAAVLRGIRCLKRNDTQFNVLSLISQANVRRGREVYRYLRDMGVLFHQYIPCVESDAHGLPMPYSISGEEWGDCLCGIFDEWYRHDTHTISIRLFDSILASLLGMAPNICHMEDNCCQYFVVEHNGDVYPCDFFVEAERRLGNIMQQDWLDLWDSEVYKAFGSRKMQLNSECMVCPYARYCMGDCLKHRTSSVTGSLSRLCLGWKQFFRHALPRFHVLASTVREYNYHEQLADITGEMGIQPSVGRNAPCPCGSGRKYKKCHGNTDAL